VIRPRKRVFTRGRVVAWVVSLALGIGWAMLLRSTDGDLRAVAVLLLAVGGLFGTLFGVLAATGLLVRVMRLLGNPTRAVSSSPEELPPDLTFGVCLILFFLPSLLVYYGL
jgi:hypothetical protein